MERPDDSTLSSAGYKRVREEAHKALSEACAFGEFPTPVADIMSVADLELSPDDVLNESFLSKIRKKAGSALKSALSKVFGLIDLRARIVFIDRAVLTVKQTFLKLHETGHAFLPWQRDLYIVVEESESELDPEIADLFDREANIFATEVLFQLDSFIEEAEDSRFGINVPLKLSKKYGSSVYAALRQYVSKSSYCCSVLVLNPPELLEGDGFRVSLRRQVAAPNFAKKFGRPDWPEFFTPDDQIGAMIPMKGRRMSGRRQITLIDCNGVSHECVAEAFATPYQVFILILDVRERTKSVFVL